MFDIMHNRCSFTAPIIVLGPSWLSTQTEPRNVKSHGGKSQSNYRPSNFTSSGATYFHGHQDSCWCQFFLQRFCFSVFAIAAVHGTVSEPYSGLAQMLNQPISCLTTILCSNSRLETWDRNCWMGVRIWTMVESISLVYHNFLGIV